VAGHKPGSRSRTPTAADVSTDTAAGVDSQYQHIRTHVPEHASQPRVSTGLGTAAAVSQVSVYQRPPLATSRVHPPADLVQAMDLLLTMDRCGVVQPQVERLTC
jgi:hypothetical protein